MAEDRKVRKEDGQKDEGKVLVHCKSVMQVQCVIVARQLGPFLFGFLLGPSSWTSTSRKAAMLLTGEETPWDLD